MILSPTDEQALRLAKHLLENPSLAARITSLIGTPIEKALRYLPENWSQQLGEVTQNALIKASDAAIFTMTDTPHLQSSNTLHKLGVAISGGVGGFWGLGALVLELPISTTIMLRSIADIARSEGESIQDIETKMACLEVFALGGRSDTDDAAESGYFMVRATLAKSVADTIHFMAKEGVAKEGSPLLIRFIAKVAERFGVQVTEKAAAQAIPALGAAGGSVINTIFIDHFQDMARGHFIVRRLEREYGAERIKRLYEALPE